MKSKRHPLQRLRSSPTLFAVPAALFLLATAIYPLIELIRMSLSRVTVSNILRTWPFVGLAEFKQLISSAQFIEALINTLIYTAVVLIVGIAGGLLVALVLSSTPRSRGSGGLEVRFSRFVFGMMVFVWMLPPVVAGSLWKFLLDKEGVVSFVLANLHVIAHPVPWLVQAQNHTALLAVAVVNAWVVVPFAALVFRAAILDIPPDPIDAAQIDGATRLQVFRHITLPMLRSTFLILVVLTIVYAFRSFDFIYVMTSGGPGTATTTLPYLSYRLSFENYKFGLGAATAVISIVMVLATALLYIRANRKEVG